MLALELYEGRPQLLVEGGEEPLKLVLNTTVHDGNWHKIHFHLHQKVRLRFTSLECWSVSGNHLFFLVVYMRYEITVLTGVFGAYCCMNLWAQLFHQMSYSGELHVHTFLLADFFDYTVILQIISIKNVIVLSRTILLLSPISPKLFYRGAAKLKGVIVGCVSACRAPC